MKTLLGKKIGMTQIFAEDGTVIPVTVVEAGPETVVQIKTVEKDGYDAVQVGYEDQKPQRVNKPIAGHFAKAGVDTSRRESTSQSQDTLRRQALTQRSTSLSSSQAKEKLTK